MTATLKLSLRFSLRLFIILIILYGIHEFIHFRLGFDWGAYLLTEAYWSNYLMVVLTYWALMMAKKKNNQAVGFMFMGGFFIKLIVFMIFFNPIYKADLQIEPAEFIAFFTPYSLCLTLETTSLVRLLNRS